MSLDTQMRAAVREWADARSTVLAAGIGDTDYHPKLDRLAKAEGGLVLVAKAMAEATEEPEVFALAHVWEPHFDYEDLVVCRNCGDEHSEVCGPRRIGPCHGGGHVGSR